MLKQILSAVLILVLNLLSANGQTDTNQDTIVIEKASFHKDKLGEYLSKNLVYPMEAIERNIQGDVVLSMVITKAGKMEKIVKVNSPNMLLLSNSLDLLEPLGNGWTPAKENGIAIDKSYRFVLRYRLLVNSTPINYGEQIEGLIKKQKYERALKISNQAIKDNMYEHTYYELRAEVKELLGDTAGAKADKLAASSLNNDIMLTVNIIAYGVVRKPMIIETRVEKVR